MTLVERLRKIFRGQSEEVARKDAEIKRLTQANDSLISHNKTLSQNLREARTQYSDVARENRRLKGVVASVQGFVDELDPPEPADEAS